MAIIRILHPQDYPEVRAIYEEGIQSGIATFTPQAPEWEGWDKAHLPVCRLAAEVEHQVVGWAALTPYSARDVYKGVAEESIYVASSMRGQGIGKELLETLAMVSEHQGFWTLQAGIFEENTASIHLHNVCGFEVVGIRERIGCIKGVWKNIVLMERRSNWVGC